MSTIALLPFFPGDLPLDGGFSAIADLDDIVLGESMLYDLDAHDALLDDTPTHPMSLPASDLATDSVEAIFDDLHAACEVPASDDPLTLPARPFFPWNPVYDADSPPPSPTWRAPGTQALEAALAEVGRLSTSDWQLTQEACGVLNTAAACFQAVQLAGATHEDDGSDDDSDWDLDSDCGDICGACRCGSCGPIDDAPQDGIAFEEVPPSPVRPVHLLGRRAPQASPKVFASAAAAPSKPRSKRTTVAPAAAPAAQSKKRKAKRAAGPAAAKRAAASSEHTTLPRPVPISVIPEFSGPHVPSQSHYEALAPKYHHFLAKGCTVKGKGLKCNNVIEVKGLKGRRTTKKCGHVTGNYGDMERHLMIHSRAESELFCIGCPKSFARKDALERHLFNKGSSHTRPARKAFLLVFNSLPQVMDIKAQCPRTNTRVITAMEKELDNMFDILFKASKA
ncbi:hypothetical protein B0H19DRAFT_1258852 [Mycena capillaripes]|nr:hypothetical protein B0H19DRAFT_1258852 [Mycena capillaripes]